MSKASTSPGRTRARPGFAWKRAFLAELAETSNVSAASRAAKVDTATAYKLRRSDRTFARQWFEALCEGYDNLELDLLRRLREGELAGATTPAGKARRKFDNATALRLLAAHRSAVQMQRGRDDYAHEDELLASINAKLEKMRQREIAARERAAEKAATGAAAAGQAAPEPGDG